MMSAKRMVAVAAATIGLVSVAHAADLPARVAPAPYVPSAPIFTWTGAYFGINGGYSFSNNTKFNIAAATASDNGIANGNRPSSFRNSDDGFTAGAQFGYNYEFNGFGSFGGAGSGIVIGFEADAAYIDSARTGTENAINDVGNTAISNFRSGLDFLGTARGRLGYAFNQFLIYGTGGFAYGDTFQSARLFTAGNAAQLRYFGSHSDIQTGYAYGGGIEYALPTSSFLNFFHSSAVTIKAEYLHYDLGNSSFVAHNLVVNQTTSAYNMRTRTEGDLARVGLNYKF
jgi:outer membrane immunogenic protein